MSRSVWCSAYSNSYTYTQFSGKTGVLMASPIYVKVKSEFSLKKKSTQGENFTVTQSQWLLWGPNGQCLMMAGLAATGSPSSTNSWDHMRPRTLIHILLLLTTEMWREGWWPCFTKAWDMGSQKPLPIPVHIKWPEVQHLPIPGTWKQQTCGQRILGFPLPTQPRNGFCEDLKFQED